MLMSERAHLHYLTTVTVQHSTSRNLQGGYQYDDDGVSCRCRVLDQRTISHGAIHDTRMTDSPIFSFLPGVQNASIRQSDGTDLPIQKGSRITYNSRIYLYSSMELMRDDRTNRVIEVRITATDEGPAVIPEEAAVAEERGEPMGIPHTIKRGPREKIIRRR